MKRLLTLLVLVVIKIHLVSGNSIDSLMIHELLTKGRIMETTDNDGAMAIYKSVFEQVHSGRIITGEIAEVYLKLARYEYYRGNTEVAITLALEALGYYEEQIATKKATETMLLVGDILRGNELLDQSREYLVTALNQAKNLNDSDLLRNAYNRLAALGINDIRIAPDTTEYYAKLSLAISRLQKNGKMISNNLNILGVYEIQRGNYQQSLSYLKEAYAIAHEFSLEDEPLILHNLARNYFALGFPKKAIELDKMALQSAQKLQIPQYIRLASSYLKDYFISTGDYQEGLKYAILYYDAKDFILTQKVLVQLKEFNNRIKTEKQHLENQRLLYEQKLIDGRLNTYMIIGVLLTILLIVSTGFMLYHRRQKHETRKIASRLDQSNKVLTRFISILGHDLRSPFNAILGFTDILKNESDQPVSEREKIIDRLYTVSRSTYKLLERILEWSRLQSGSIRPMMKYCDFSELVRETINILEPAAMLKKIEISYNYPGPVTIFADENMILTVIRNILSNAIKFSHPGGRIEIEPFLDRGMVSLGIRDHGIGISSENLTRLFQLDNYYKSQGTSGESGTGLGLILCKEYLAMHRGNLKVDSQEAKGSTFTITIPQT